jgi:hypothetical protein
MSFVIAAVFAVITYILPIYFELMHSVGLQLETTRNKLTVLAWYTDNRHSVEGELN